MGQKSFGHVQRLATLYPLGVKGTRYKIYKVVVNVGKMWLEVLKTSGIRALKLLDVLQSV